MQHDLKLEIGIVGAGIGGLSAAVSLSQRGHRVTVFEAASELTQIGAGIQITPNASKQLLRWGIGNHLAELNSGRTPRFQVRRWLDGNIIGSLETQSYAKSHGGPYIQVHRADLQHALLAVAGEQGVEVKTGARVKKLDLSEGTRPALVLEDGRSIIKDLLIAADGIKSTIRQDLSAASGTRPLPPIDSKIAVYRATLQTKTLADDPELSHLVHQSGSNIWIGPGKHAVVYVMRGDSLVNLVLEFHESREVGQLDKSAYVQDIQTLYADWDPKLNKMLHMIDSALRWPLYFDQPQESSISQCGRVLLLGDAAHVVPSFLAQGAAMAIEDASLLGKLLDGVSSYEDVPIASRQFQRVRMTRKIRVQELSLQNVHLYHLDDGEEQQKRDDPAQCSGGILPIWKDTDGRAWLYGYDAENDV